jgi:hypothetical protein
VRELLGAFDETHVARRVVRSDHRFAGVHVRVLPAVRRRLAVGRRLVGIEAAVGLEELALGGPV